MRERDIEKTLVKKVASLGGIAYKFRSPSRRGVPDRLCLLPGGRVVFVELKATGKELRKLQEFERRRIEGLGFRVERIDSVEEVEAMFDFYEEDVL